MAELSFTCPTTTSGLLNLEDHENIDSLVHSLSEDTFTDIIRSGQKVTNVNTLTAPAGTDVRTTSVSRDNKGVVTGTVDVQYDASGTAIQTLITTINRDVTGKVISTETDEVT